MKKKKARGSRTHGHGSSKKWRGAGSRGGRGRAGMGKKAKHKKISLKQEIKKKGVKKGFHSINAKLKTINVGQINEKIDKFAEAGSAVMEKGKYVFYANKAGFDKILGGGVLSKKIDIKARYFTERAKNKIESAGCKALEIGVGSE